MSNNSSNNVFSSLTDILVISGAVPLIVALLFISGSSSDFLANIRIPAFLSELFMVTGMLSIMFAFVFFMGYVFGYIRDFLKRG